MQFLEDKQVKKSLREIQIKPVSEDVRQRMLKTPYQSHRNRSIGIAALFLVTASIFTLTILRKPSTSPIAVNTDTHSGNAVPTLSPAPVKSEGQRYFMPKSQEIVYIDETPYHKVKYLVMDREDVEIEGSVMQVLKPREEQYLVPASIY